MSELKPCPYDEKMWAKILERLEDVNLGWVETDQGEGEDCLPYDTVCRLMLEAASWNTRASGWIACSERLPEKDGAFLVYLTDIHGMTSGSQVAEFSNREAPNHWNCPCWFEITHWMPLPEPPR